MSTSRPTARVNARRAAGASASSVTSTSTWRRVAMVDRPTTPHLLWSATTITRRAASTIARSVAPSTRLGVVRPWFTVMPCTPSTRVSTCSVRSAASATGPTRALDGVRSPPTSTTVRSRRAGSCIRSATGGEFVTIVSSGTGSSSRATASVVVPAEIATDSPGWISAAQACAIACFCSRASADLATKPGSSLLRAPRAVAPPCTRSTSPRRASCSMSRRTVMSETASSSTSSLTRAPPVRRTCSRILSWRWRASISAARARRPRRPVPAPACRRCRRRPRDRAR